MKIALLSCSKQKRSYPCQAKELYSASELFSLSYRYAQTWADQVYILSAKYGLVKDSQVLAPYDLSLNDLPASRQQDWANYVIGQMEQIFDLEHDDFMILAGETYCRNLIPRFKHCILPLRHMRLGPRIQFLQEQLRNGFSPEVRFPDRADGEPVSIELHRVFSAMPRYSWQDIDKIPFCNGIYIMFEAGELYHGYPRIVRVGTHVSDGRLKKRLKDHYITEKKDGSIFRKNIGKAILNGRGDPYLPVWSLDTSKPESKALADSQRETMLEAEVSRWLRSNITFTVLEITEKENRLRMEEAIIAQLHQTPDFGPGAHWLGLSSPEWEIRDSGMWLKQGLQGQSLTGAECTWLLNHAGQSGVPECSTSQVSSSEIKVGMPQIRAYIGAQLDRAKLSGVPSCVLISGEIHKEMGLSRKMPSVCAAMYQMMKETDKILHTTPSGKSSTIKIEYYF